MIRRKHNAAEAAEELNLAIPFEKPGLKEHSFLKKHMAKNSTHDADPEKATQLVHNLIFDAKNPDIINNPFLNRKKE